MTTYLVERRSPKARHWGTSPVISKAAVYSRRTLRRVLWLTICQDDPAGPQ
jgi:hypothetical protein